MRAMTGTALTPGEFTRSAISRETWFYAMRKPGKVPPADSPSRPQLAWLWRAAHLVTLRRPHARTFTYAGAKFGIVSVSGQPHVFDWGTRELLVRPPNSFQALDDLLEANPCTAMPGKTSHPKDPTA